MHLTNFIGGHRRGKLNPAPYLDHLRLEEFTLAEALKTGGYRTGFFGKWHLGGEPYWPEKQGFDLNIAGCAGRQTEHRIQPVSHPTFHNGPKGEYLTDRLTDEAIKFIGQNRDRSFFVYLCHYAVHIPLQPKAAFREKYQSKLMTFASPPGPEFLPEGNTRTRQNQSARIRGDGRKRRSERRPDHAKAR